MSELTTVVVDAIKPLAGAILVWLGTQAALWLRSRTKNERIEVLTKRLFEVIRMVVLELLQTWVERSKEVGVGKLPPMLAQEIKAQAMSKVKQAMGESDLQSLASGLKMDQNALELMISSGIEASLYAVKKAPAAVLPPFLQGNPVVAAPAVLPPAAPALAPQP